MAVVDDSWDWDNIDWWQSPSMAYAAGLSHGFARGYAQAQARQDVDMASILHNVFGPRGALVRRIEQDDARRLADRAGSRTDDWQGRVTPRSGAT